MKSIYEYSKPIRNLFICHEALRKLGFQAEDIYISYKDKKDTIVIRNDGRLAIPIKNEKVKQTTVIMTILKTQDKELGFHCGECKNEDVQKMTEQWDSFVNHFNGRTMNEVELQKLFHEWPLGISRTDFVHTLVKNGFILPSTMN